MELTPKLENLLREYNYNKPKLGKKASLPRTIVSNALESKEQLDKLLILPKLVDQYKYTHMMLLEKEIVDQIAEAVKEAIPNYDKKWLTPTELEAYIGIPKGQQAKMRMSSNSSKIPFSKIGNYIIYEKEKIDQWLSDNHVQ